MIHMLDNACWISPSAVSRQIQRIAQRLVELDQLQDPLMRRLQQSRRSQPSIVRLQPAQGAQAPALRVLQSQKLARRYRRNQIVAMPAGKDQKPIGNLGVQTTCKIRSSVRVRQ